jgi:WD40 repeat protein
VGFSGAGRRLVTHDGFTPHVLDLERSADPRTMKRVKRRDGSMSEAFLSDDGRYLIGLVSPGSVAFWDLDRPDEPPVELPRPEGDVSAVDLAGVAGRIAIAGRGATVGVWDVTKPGQALASLGRRDVAPTAMAFTPDGRSLVTAAGDLSVRFWNVEGTPDPPRILWGHQGPVTSLAMASDGKTLATAGGDDPVRTWSLPALLAAASPAQTLSGIGFADVPHRELPGHDLGVQCFALASEARRLAAFGSDFDESKKTGGYKVQTVRIHDIDRPGAQPRILRGSNPFLHELAITRDGRWLAAEIDKRDKGIRVFDLDAPDRPGRLLADPETDVQPIPALSPDGRMLVLKHDFSKSLTVWDLGRLDSHKPEQFSGHGAEISAMTIDGRRVISGSFDKSVRVWDLNQPKAPPHVLRGHSETPEALAIAPGGTRLAVMGDKATIWLWDIANPSAEPVLLECPAKPIAIRISPDGRRLAAGLENGKIRLWSLEIDPLIKAATDADYGGNFSLGEWQQYFGRTRYRPTVLDGKYPKYDPNYESIAQNLSRAEWEEYFPGEPYQKTFPDRPVPPDDKER